MGMKQNLPSDPLDQQDDINFSRQSYEIATKAQKQFILIIAAAFTLLIIWSNFAQLDIVVRGSGQVEPSLQNQMIQHFEGGIIEEILVAEGQTVRAGDIIMRIKNSFSQAELNNAKQLLLSQEIKSIRLKAQVELDSKLILPEAYHQKAPELVRSEKDLFLRKIAVFDEELLILRDQYQRKKLEKEEKTTRLANIQKEFSFMEQRVNNLKRLQRSGAASRNELLKDQTSLQKIKTRVNDLSHQIPQIDLEMSEILRRQENLRLNFTSQAREESVEVDKSIKQLEKTLLAMQDRSKRTDVRAPIDGKIHRLFQTTIGGVVQSGQNIAQLNPLDPQIAISIQLPPKDRGKVWTDLPATVKLSAYDFSTYGGLEAIVSDISSDVFQDESGAAYYKVTLAADTQNFGSEKPIIAGMSAEVDIITGQRTILDYFLAPIKTVGQKALREG